MPLLRIETNVSLAKDQVQHLMESLTELISSALNKPKRFVQIIVDQSKQMSFAGTQEPTAYLELRSLGLTGEKIELAASELTRWISNTLGIGPERIFINFIELDRAHWAWCGKTFA